MKKIRTIKGIPYRDVLTVAVCLTLAFFAAWFIQHCSKAYQAAKVRCVIQEKCYTYQPSNKWACIELCSDRAFWGKSHVLGKVSEAKVSEAKEEADSSQDTCTAR